MGEVYVAGSDFAFHHLETREDVEQHLELMRKVFGENERVDLQVRKWIDHHPAMSLNDFFVIKHRGRVVAALNVIPVTWSVGGIKLKVSELGCVATLPDFRNHDLQRKLQTEYHEQLSEQEYDLSAIEGIPYFYRQFGYEYALPLGEQAELELDKIPDYEIGPIIRPFERSDIPQASRLLNKTQEKFYVHTVRKSDIWKLQQDTGMIAEYNYDGYAVEVNGKMVAYFRTSYNPKEKALIVREVTDVDQTTARSILRFLKDDGVRRGAGKLVATVSYQEPFIEHLAAIGGAKQVPPYAWQLRVTDYVKMFRKLKPLFEQRLADSTYRHLTELVNFNFYSYTVQLAVQDGAITGINRLETNEDRNIRTSPTVFTQLLFGYRSRGELESIYPDFIIRPTHRYLIDILFPKMPSYIHTEY